MRRFELAIPTIAVAILTMIAIPMNLRCRLFFPGGARATSRLTFSFGWPVSYLKGPVPSALVTDHPEFTNLQRSTELSFSLRQLRAFGSFSFVGLAANVVLVECVWPILWYLIRRARLDKEAHTRFAGLAKGGRVRIQAGAFADAIGIIADVEIAKDQIAVRVEVANESVVLHLKPEDIERSPDRR